MSRWTPRFASNKKEPLSIRRRVVGIIAAILEEKRTPPSTHTHSHAHKVSPSVQFTLHFGNDAMAVGGETCENFLFKEKILFVPCVSSVGKASSNEVIAET